MDGGRNRVGSRFSEPNVDTSTLFSPVDIGLLHEYNIDAAEICLDSEETAAILQEALSLEEAGLYKEAYSKFDHESQENSSLANYFVGIMSRHGIGTEIDCQKGFKSLLRAAHLCIKDSSGDNQNYRPELGMIFLELGICCYYGWGTSKDRQCAFKYFQMASQLGDLDALLELAKCYMKGKGTSKNKEMAAKCYRMAEELGRIIPGNSWIYKEKYDAK